MPFLIRIKENKTGKPQSIHYYTYDVTNVKMNRGLTSMKIGEDPRLLSYEYMHRFTGSSLSQYYCRSIIMCFIPTYFFHDIYLSMNLMIGEDCAECSNSLLIY